MFQTEAITFTEDDVHVAAGLVSAAAGLAVLTGPALAAGASLRAPVAAAIAGGRSLLASQATQQFLKEAIPQVGFALAGDAISEATQPALTSSQQAAVAEEEVVVAAAPRTKGPARLPGKPKGGANPAVRAAAGRGSRLHSDKPGNLPDQLRLRYPNTVFEFTKPGVAGQDVRVAGGLHPSNYPGSSWPSGIDFADFKPGTPSGARTFATDQAKKWKEPTHMLPYDPQTGSLR